MDTLTLLARQYQHRALIPLEDVRRDFFPDLNEDGFQRAVKRGAIRLPIVRPSTSRKAPKFVHLQDLAAFFDELRSQARAQAA